MFDGTQEIMIASDKASVYAKAATYPMFIRFFKKGSRIIEETDERSVVEVHANLLGVVPTKWFGEGVKKPNEFIDFTQTVGLFKGLKALWSFESVEGGTKVSIRTTFSKPRLGVWFENFLGRCVVEKTTARILGELKAACGG